MSPRLRDALDERGFSLRDPVSNFVLARLIAEAPFALPAAYLDLLMASNGGEGSFAPGTCPGSVPSRIALHSAESALSEHRGYCVDELAPDCFLIGTSGKGEFFLLEQGDDGRVFSCRASDVGERPRWQLAFETMSALVAALR